MANPGKSPSWGGSSKPSRPSVGGSSGRPGRPASGASLGGTRSAGGKSGGAKAGGARPSSSSGGARPSSSSGGARPSSSSGGRPGSCGCRLRAVWSSGGARGSSASRPGSQRRKLEHPRCRPPRCSCSLWHVSIEAGSPIRRGRRRQPWRWDAEQRSSPSGRLCGRQRSAGSARRIQQGFGLVVGALGDGGAAALRPPGTSG